MSALRGARDPHKNVFAFGQLELELSYDWGQI